MNDHTVLNPVTCAACGTVNPADASVCTRCSAVLPQPVAPTSYVISIDLPPGTVFHNRYEILGPLGRGGMGMVFKARDRTLDEVVAIKILRPDFAQDPKMAERFKSEIRLARRIRHRNVCAIHDFGEDRGLLYISMELIEGVDLKRVLTERGALPEGEAYDMSIQVAHGLQAVHDAGIVHRDLKTPNVMCDTQGVARLMDFGIAKRLGDGTATATGQIVGTPEYMSPEQAQGQKLDARSDVYALGIVVYELFTGRVPFRGETPISTILKHINDPPPLDGPEGARLPPELRQVLHRALAKNRDNRFGSAREMAEALLQAKIPSLRQQPTPTEALVAPTLQVRRRGFRPMHAALLAAALGAVAVGIVLGGRARTAPESTPAAPPTTVAAVTLPAATSPPATEATLRVAPSVQSLDGVPRPTLAAARPTPRPTVEPRSPVTAPPTTVARVAEAPSPAPVTEAPRVEAAGNGELVIAAKPWGEVTIDGRAVGSTPLGSITLAAGMHRVRVRHPAHEPVERDVLIRAGQTERLVVDFIAR